MVRLECLATRTSANYLTRGWNAANSRRMIYKWNIRREPMRIERRGEVCRGSRSRQELEAEYYREWERLTLVSEEELNRKMTFLSFLKFIPMWLRYNGLPGPVRYFLFAKRARSSVGENTLPLAASRKESATEIDEERNGDQL